jgi:Flp pilus assembly pilin Flp
LTAWIVLGLGSLVLVGGLAGLINAVRDREPGMSLVGRLLVLTIVAVAMVRAAAKLGEGSRDA